MGVLSLLLTILFGIVSVLLILIVLIQDEDGTSLGGVFAGSSNTAFGARSANVIQKFTYTLGALFFVLAIGLAFVNRTVDSAPSIKVEESTVNEWWNASVPAASSDTGALPAEQPATSPTN